MGLAEDRFASLCPSLTVSQYCANSAKVAEVCCTLCPNSISGIEGHIALAFSSLSSIAAIALSPESAPSSLFVNVLQANAYAISLLGYLLSNGASSTPTLDYFHAAYALMLALSCLIPLSAIAASPPWAVTGEENPAVTAAKAERAIIAALKSLESGEAGHAAESTSSDTDSDGEDRAQLRKRRAGDRKKLTKAMKRRPAILLRRRRSKKICGFMTLSHLTLYLGFSSSVLLWGLCFFIGIWGAATGSASVALSQSNCLQHLSGATFLLWSNLGLLLLAVVVFIATIINPLVTDVADAFGRVSLISCTSNQQIVFGVSFAVYLLWMFLSFTAYYQATNSILMIGSEFYWSFGSTFSALMVLVPISNVIQALWRNR